MLTARCLAVAFLTPWVVGAPAVWLLRGGRPLRRTDWLWAPFIGIATVVGVLHPLVVFADLPLERTAPGVAGAVLAGWAALLSRPNGRASLRRFPGQVATLSLSVYLTLGVGVWVEGVERCRGNMQSDQYQYVALAQFLIEEPFSTGWADVGHRPWLVQPVALKADRLGQSVLHGFLAVVAGSGALELYFPTQLLGAALLCPAVRLLASEFPLTRRLALGAAVVAALAPGTTFLQSHCYLSHVLCVPALVAFLAAVIRLSRGGGLRPLPYAVAAFGLGFAVYTEFAPLFLGAAAAALATGALVGLIGTGRVSTVAAGLAAAVALSPATAAGARSVWGRSLEHGEQMTLAAPMPVWAACVWANSNSAWRLAVPTQGLVLRVLVGASFALAALGAAAFALHALRRNPAAIPTVAGTASLLVPPLLVWAIKPGSVYVISKLLWTLTPVLVLFAACAARAFAGTWKRIGVPDPQARRLATVALGSFGALWIGQSVIEQKGHLEPLDNRTRYGRIWNDPALTEVCAVLRDRPATDVLLALEDAPEPPSIEATALCFHGRRHRIWIASPHRVWYTDLDHVPAAQLSDLTTLPPDAAVIVSRGGASFEGEILFRNDRYEVVRLTALNRVRVERFRTATGHARLGSAAE